MLATVHFCDVEIAGIGGTIAPASFLNPKMTIPLSNLAQDGLRMPKSKAWQMYPMLNIEDFLLNQPPGDAVKCGNRLDLFRKQRRHEWFSMGLDWGHGMDGYFVPCLVLLCMRCGVGHASALE